VQQRRRANTGISPLRCASVEMTGFGRVGGERSLRDTPPFHKERERVGHPELWRAGKVGGLCVVAKAHALLRQKFAAEQQAIAMTFEVNSGRCAWCTKSRIRIRFPSIETRPLERWNRTS